jgi:hypothetical protein
MSRATSFKQNVVLFLFILSLVVSFAAIGAVIGLFWSEEREQENQPVLEPALLPLIVEPNRIDFNEVDEGQHEGIVHLVNQSDRTISLLFAKSSCRCSVAELPGDTILPGEKLAMKCSLSTAGRISERVGGEIWIAYRFADLDEEEDATPMYVRVILTAVVNPVSLSALNNDDSDQNETE